MSKTIRIDDRLYDTLEAHRNKNESFNDVVERLAREAGLFGRSPRALDELRTELKDQYNLSSDQIQVILYALRDVYIACDASSSAIGPSRDDLDESRHDELEILKQLELIESKTSRDRNTRHYKPTKIGNKIGADVVREYLETIRVELQSLLSSYGRTKVAFFLAFGFQPDRSNHLSTSIAELTREGSDEWWHDDSNLLEEYNSFVNDLLSLEVAFEAHYQSGPQVSLPPEFDDKLATLDREFERELQDMEAYRILKRYADGRVSTSSRDNVLRELQVADEATLAESINRLSEKGLTSRYSGGDPPFFVLDRAGLLRHIEHRVQGHGR